MTRLLAGASLALMLATSAALAGAPQPVRPVPPGMYAGRWYQIAQIVKSNAHPCPQATDDFQPGVFGVFTVVMSCREPSGKVRQMRAKGVVEPNTGAAKFKIGFLGGLFSQEYWILDHAPDGSWALMATPGGNYLWLLARRPVLDPRSETDAITRIRALGYDIAHLAPNR